VHPYVQKCRKGHILGCPHRVPDSYLQVITFIMRKIPEDPAPPGRLGGCRFSYIQSEYPTCMKALMVGGGGEQGAKHPQAALALRPVARLT
jgi:hypothetical protein